MSKSREAREKGFETKKHYVGADDRAPSNAIPGYTGHMRNSKDIFGQPAGRVLEIDAAGGLDSHVSQPVGASSGSTFISALPSDGAVWDHGYETTTKAMHKTTEKMNPDLKASVPGEVIGYTGHIHSMQDSIGKTHSRVVQEAAESPKQAGNAIAGEESRPHWTQFATQGSRAWKQEYAQTLTTRPNPRKAEGSKNGSGGIDAPDADIAARCPPRRGEKQIEDEEFLDMGPRPLFLYDNTLMTEAPEDEQNYTGHFSTSQSGKRIIGYTGHLHGAQDTLGLNFTRVERRVNPYEKPPEETHPLGARYQTAAPPLPPCSPELKALVQRPARPRRSQVDVINQVRQKIMQRGGRNGFRTLVRVMRIMDDDGNKQLNMYELQSGMNNYGIHPSPQDMDALMKYFDRDGSGQISVTEMMRGLRGEINERRAKLVYMAYALIDANSDGVVKMCDLKKLYDASQHPEVLSGEKTPIDVLNEFAKGWDKNEDGTIMANEFLDYYSDLSAGIDNDDYFELMMRNAWHIYGGDGVAANTSCRRVVVVHMDGSESVEVIKNDLGIGPQDVKKMRERLEEDGITDIKQIKMYG